MSAIQLWAVDPSTIPTPGPGSVLVFVNEAGELCSKTESGAVVSVRMPGPVGAAGEAGAVGPQGLPGADGGPGPQGPQGLAGPGGAAGLSGPQGPQGLPGPSGAAGADGAAGAVGAVGATGATGPQGDPGAAGEVGPQGPQGVAGSIAGALVAKAYSGLPAWTTAQTIMLGFQPPDLSVNGGSIGFVVMGSNDHMTTAANLVMVLKIGGVARLTQSFPLGTIAKTARAWRVEGRIIYEAGQMVASMSGEVDGMTAQLGIGLGSKLAVSLGDYVEVVAYLSAAVAGAGLRCLSGFAYREF